MTEAITPPSEEISLSAQSGVVSVETRPAKTLPGIAGVLLALLGLGMIAAGGVGVTVAGPFAALIPIGANLLVVLTSEQQITPVVNTGVTG